MKAGDVVQIRQREFLHDALPIKADPPIHAPGPIDFWIYARVFELLPDGTVRVIVNHPGNREHGAEKIVDAADIRTKSEVTRLAAANHHANPAWNAKLQEHYKIQAERLKESA